jgi:hypothetical protein
MPKEAAWMVLIAVVVARIPFFRSNSRKTFFPVGVCILLGVGMITLSTQRQLFALHPSRNYYHWLIVDELIRNSSLPKVYAGDHLYFPNLNDQKNEGNFLWINGDALHQTYKEFSHEISTIKTQEVIGLQHFVLIHDWPKEECIKRIRNFGKTNIKVSRSLNKDSKFFADEIQLETGAVE